MYHRHLRNIDCLTARTACLVMNVSFVKCCSRKKKKRRLFCAALVAGTVNKLEQSILRLRYLWYVQFYLFYVCGLVYNRRLCFFRATLIFHRWTKNQQKLFLIVKKHLRLYYKTFYDCNLLRCLSLSVTPARV
jgi:hypothetical protein